MSKKEHDMENITYSTITVDIPYELKDKLKFHSYKEKKSIKDIVKEALETYFEKEEHS